MTCRWTARSSSPRTAPKARSARCGTGEPPRPAALPRSAAARLPSGADSSRPTRTVSAWPPDMPIACSSTRKPRQAGHQNRPHHRRHILGVRAVALQRGRHRLALLLAETFCVVSDFGSHLLAVIRQRHEFHRNPGERGIGAEPPQRPQRLRRLQRSRLHLKTFFGAAAEDLEEQLLHGAEVVVHQLRFQPRLARKTARRHRGIALFDHQLLGRVEQQAAVLRVRRPDPAGRCHAAAPYSVRSVLSCRSTPIVSRLAVRP